MKRKSFKKGLLIVMVLALLLTSCSFGTQIQDQFTLNMRTSSQEEMQSGQNTDVNAKKSWNPYADAPPVKPVPLDTKIQLDGNTLTYGKLQITLPDNVTIEEQKSENDTRVINFTGMEKNENGPFPPRVWFAHYHAKYQDKWELASKLLDLFPDTTLRFYDKPGDNLHYFFTYDKPCKNGYIMVYGNDICIVEEIASESDYSFGNLLVSDEVHWENSIQQIDVRGGSIAYADLCKIKADKDCTLLVEQSADEDSTREISLFQDGCFAAPIMAFSFAVCPLNIEFEDYNFDGCLDMIVSYEKIYLWNADKKAYEAAQLTEDLPNCFGPRERYPETQTVWGYRIEYVEDAYGEMSWDRFDRIEIFWKWEGNALVKKRECVAQVREENVRIFAYEDSSQKMLFDETFTVEEWEENSAAVQKQFQQFYAGMIPEGKRSKYLHTIDYDKEHQQYIPQTLLDKITKAMLDDKVPETLAEFQNDNKLTSDEIFAIAKDNLEMRNDVVRAGRIEPETVYVMDAVDGDNDGIMDLIGVAYYHGYGNSTTDVVFYQGQKDGTYQKTQSSSYRAEQVAALSYEGKNYLCQIHYGEKKTISLACYVDGAIAETVYLTFVPERYEIRLAECAERKYKTLAEEILKNSSSYKEKIDKHEKIDGGSEERISTGEYEYQCDLNNDDALEQYYKSFWLRDLEYLDFGGEGKGIEPVSEITQSESAVMMWVEPFEKRNIVNIISRTEWEDFEITGYFINGMEYQQVYRITADAVAGVRQERYDY